MAKPTKSIFQTRIILLVRRYYLFFVIFVMLGAALFYYLSAEQMRAAILVKNPDLFVTDDIVNIVEIIDGDEVIIRNNSGEETLCRLLGIKSFSPTIKDPLLSNYGSICFQYLKTYAIDKEARLVLTDKRIDGRGRLLGTLNMIDSEGEYAIDLGRHLLEKGYSLVYVRFDFLNMEKYLKTQTIAMEEKAGFWGNKDIKDRSLSLLTVWEEEKNND